MLPTRSVLLDLDGTLVDSQPGILASCTAALRALGHDPGNLDLTNVIGPPLEEIMRDLLARYGDDRVDEGVAAYRAHYGDSGYLGSTPYAGIGEALAGMKQAGLRLYLATSKREMFARRILEHLQLAGLFDGLYGSVPGGAIDHKPELLAHIVQRHAIAPADAVMVGDRRYDIAGARAVGMRGLGVLWGYGSRAELEAAGADRVIAEPAELSRAALSMLA